MTKGLWFALAGLVLLFVAIWGGAWLVDVWYYDWRGAPALFSSVILGATGALMLVGGLITWDDDR
jgi:hypothetical protein